LWSVTTSQRVTIGPERSLDSLVQVQRLFYDPRLINVTSYVQVQPAASLEVFVAKPSTYARETQKRPRELSGPYVVRAVQYVLCSRQLLPGVIITPETFRIANGRQLLPTKRPIRGPESWRTIRPDLFRLPSGHAFAFPLPKGPFPALHLPSTCERASPGIGCSQIHPREERLRQRRFVPPSPPIGF
jgi:hypothetical protein